MSDEKALLAAIWDEPHDDTVRLVYADWLQENGRPERAEFVRVQCELARLGTWGDGVEALTAREGELWKKWARRWRKHLPSDQRGCAFHRGFPKFNLSRYGVAELVRLTAADLEHAPLSYYHYNIAGREINTVLAWPGLRFQELFSPRPPRLPKGWVERVVACADLRNVSELCAIDCKLTPEEIRLLLDAWAERHLPILRLAGEIGDEGLAALAAHPTAAKVRLLDLRGAKLGAPGMRALSASPFLQQVSKLDLSYSPIGDAGIEELIRWPHLSTVRALYLPNTKLTAAGAVALAACPALANLRELTLSDNRIGTDGCLALARSPHLGALTRLSLDHGSKAGDPAAQKELRDRFGNAVNW